jgi:hypothetical protein
LTNIVVGYQNRADFVQTSLFGSFEQHVLTLSPHLSGPEAVKLLLAMNKRGSSELIEVLDRIIGK